MNFLERSMRKKSITIETLAKAGLLDPQKASLTTKNMKSVRNQLDLTFQELKGPYTYLVTIMSLVKIKFLQKRMKHCLLAQSRLGRLPMQPAPSRLGRPPSQLGRLPMLLHMSWLGRHLCRLSHLPLLLVPRLA
jgi:hypothetical protein